MPIALDVRRALDLRAHLSGHRLFIYRIWGQVQFKQPRGWSETHLAILDTGAPYSVLPESLWRTLKIKPLFKTSLRGIAPGASAAVDALLGKVSARLCDDRSCSSILRLDAMLAKTDKVPLLLGWSGLLDRSKFFLDSHRRSAWLEF